VRLRTDPTIRAGHTSRWAILYIRQSSMRQVEEHTASGMHQRSFKNLAHGYGWEDHLIIEVDEDDGRSATNTTKRKGFQWLRQQIFEDKVGAIFCWEASRLSRDITDFTQFIKLCGTYDTLIIDGKAVYDPNDDNDNASLGIQGVMNQNESRRTGRRSKATKRTKAEAGELRLRPPTGYVYDDDDNLVFDKTENDQGSINVQDTLRLFFSTFDELRSANKVVKRFNRKGILFPTRRGRGKKSAIVWGEIDDSRALDILHNPIYAGTYAYGQTISINKMLAPDSNEQKKKIVKVGLDSDEVVIKHRAHEGYITWEKFTENQKILEDNRYGPDDRFKGPGAVREGSALLQGLGVCGICGWKLTTHYDGRDGSGVYECVNKAKRLGKSKCLTITARRLDEIVVDAFLKAVSPAQMQMTLRELEEVGKEAQTDDCRGPEELEKAKAECKKAKLRFDAIDPENTLVFREYERQLQEKMIEVQRLEKKYPKASKPPRQKLTKEELKSLLELPENLSASWKSDAVMNAERKQFLRCLIRKVIVKRREDSEYQDVIIHWASGAITSLEIVANGNFLDPRAVELMRRLAPDHTIPQIIYELHEAGYKSKGGKEWFSRDAVYQAFKAYEIKFACPEISMNGDEPRGDGRYSSTVVAKLLNVSLPTIYRWCDFGILDGIRNDAPKSNYWIKITPEQMSALKNRSVKRIEKSAIEKFKIT
jgi:DNA invertase Pin-like site-specific DNA recombinase